MPIPRKWLQGRYVPIFSGIAANHIPRSGAIETTRHKARRLKALLSTLIFSALLQTALAQGLPAGMKFHENGQPSRTGPDAAMFPDNPTRLKIDLSGTWQYTVTGKDWNTVTVPSAFEGQNKATFMRSFAVTSEMLDKYTFSLVAYGINYQSEILINGNFIGRHMGGFTSFVYPIPPNTLQVGTENSIKVSVDAELTPKTTLPLRQQVGGWRNYGGIFRDIYILATPKVYVENADVSYDSPKENKPVHMTIHATVTDRGYTPQQGEALGFQVEFVQKLNGEPAGKSGIVSVGRPVNRSATVTAEVNVPSPVLWSPESPELYVARVELVRVISKEVSILDEYDVTVGIREFGWANGRLTVNGNFEPLKGITWQEDHPLYGSALTYEVIEKDITQIKTLGANLIRFQYPPHPYVLNLCDRYGLLVMEEIPMRSVPDDILSKDYFQDLATTYAHEMIARDRQHPSVLAWGMGDGLELTSEASTEFIRSLRTTIRTLDNRPLYIASQWPGHSGFADADIAAYNSITPDVRELREALREVKTKFPGKPVIVARYGSQVEPGNHNGYSDPLSMEAQARTAMLMYEAIGEAKVAGGVFWAYNDWATDRPTLTTHSHNPYLVAMGVVSADREKRTAFDVLRALYNGEKVQALPVGNYSSNTPVIYVVAGILALISFFFLYNGNRRFRDCVNRSILRTYNFFADVRDQRILLWSHSLFLALVIAVTWATLLSSMLYHYRDNVVLDNILSQILSDGMKEWLVQLIWQPLNFIVTLSVFFFVLFCVMSVVVRLGSVLVRTHVYFYHAFSITMWSMLPYILLIPVAMVIYRLSMETDFYIMPMTVLSILITLWFLVRLLKGISIIYDVYLFKVYAVSLLILIVAGAAVYSYLDYTLSTSMYIRYFIDSVRHPS